VRREAPRECHEVRPFARKRAERSSPSPRKLAAQPAARTDFGPQAFGATN